MTIRKQRKFIQRKMRVMIMKRTYRREHDEFMNGFLTEMVSSMFKSQWMGSVT